MKVEEPQARDADWRYVLVIGAMKAGTTTVFDWLSRHSKVQASTSKEPHFFCSNSAEMCEVSCYDDLWPRGNAENKVYRLEASTGYSKYPFEKDVPKKIKQANIDVRFLYLVRDPLKRIESHYNFMKRRSYFQFEITDEHLINISNYGLQLRQYLDHYDISRFTIVDFDELRSQPEQTYCSILESLDLDFEPLTSYSARNATGTTNRLSLFILNSRYGWLLQYIPRSIVNLVRRLSDKWLPVEETYRELSQTERQIIRDALTQDMQYFARTTGFDVGKWGF